MTALVSMGRSKGVGKGSSLRAVEHERVEVGERFGAAEGTPEYSGIFGPQVRFDDFLHADSAGRGIQLEQVFPIGVLGDDGDGSIGRRLEQAPSRSGQPDAAEERAQTPHPSRFGGVLHVIRRPSSRWKHPVRTRFPGGGVDYTGGQSAMNCKKKRSRWADKTCWCGNIANGADELGELPVSGRGNIAPVRTPRVPA